MSAGIGFALVNGGLDSVYCGFWAQAEGAGIEVDQVGGIVELAADGGVDHLLASQGAAGADRALDPFAPVAFGDVVGHYVAAEAAFEKGDGGDIGTDKIEVFFL